MLRFDCSFFRRQRVFKQLYTYHFASRIASVRKWSRLRASGVENFAENGRNHARRSLILSRLRFVSRLHQTVDRRAHDHTQRWLSVLRRWQSNRPKGLQNQSNEPEGEQFWQRLLAYILLAAIFLLYSTGDPVPQVSWSVFRREMLQRGEVAKLVVNSSKDKCYVYLHHGAIVHEKEIHRAPPHFAFSINGVESFEDRLIQAQKELRIDPSGYVPVIYEPSDSIMMTFVSNLLGGLVALGVLYLLMRGLGSRGQGDGSITSMMPFTKAKARIITDSLEVKFSDIAGMDEAKLEVMEFVDYLKAPQRFTQLGARIPKGALLTGPPGTGKTLLAKAVASEADVPFISVAGPDFVEILGGIGAARVRDLFSQARKLASCIVYIDEIDAVGRARSGSGMDGQTEMENTLNQLLVEMDGINTLEGVVVMASTNRPDVLDQALLRPGRFDRQIAIDLPTLLERQAIFEVHLRDYLLAQPLKAYSRRLAALTPGHSGADIANICNEAALHAARNRKMAIDSENFEYAVERVIAGMEKKSNVMTQKEREVVAYHEAGHVLVGWMLKHTDPVLKVSIVPRTKGPLGYAQVLPSDQKFYNAEQLFDRMCMLLGGRAAEALVFRRITSGAHDDLRRVSELAYTQIQVFGMNSRIGHISFPLSRSSDMVKKPFSQKLSKMIDEEVRLQVSQAYSHTEQVLKEHHDKLRKLALSLIEREVLNYDDICHLLGPPPHADSKMSLIDFRKQVERSTHEDGVVQPSQ
ncbi:paraplegin-like [Corticium candelabrum]|uniref:paraplegin-like n=1 Tax=Corticium candelabrum TaxID=121492 RepID=UPI002E25CEDD|nr:paraplegin-like [Corticium candelabrum]